MQPPCAIVLCGARPRSAKFVWSDASRRDGAARKRGRGDELLEEQITIVERDRNSHGFSASPNASRFSSWNRREGVQSS